MAAAGRIPYGTSSSALRVLIAGGVAGGASAATRARRLSEAASITILEKGPLVSYANCGIPYALGGVIERETDLLLQTPQSLRQRYNIDVNINTEAIKICADSQVVTTRNTVTQEELHFAYDKLILSLGAEAIRPVEIPGVDLDGVYSLQTINDLQRIKEQIYQRGARSIVVVGGGYIGLETAENLMKMGLKDVSLVEKSSQLFRAVDPELGNHIRYQLEEHGVDVMLNVGLKAIERKQGGREGQGLEVLLDNEESLPADVVILALGVRPRLDLARAAGVEVGKWGVRVDEYMRTSVDNVYAVGDMVEVRQPQLHENVYLPLAGPANRQGRIAANHIFGGGEKGRTSSYRGTIGTSICKVFDLTAAATGLSQAQAKEHGLAAAEAITIHRANHATYYPGASQLTVKLTFNPEDGGKLLGAQTLGSGDGVDKRIDVLATAVQAGLTVYDVEEAELAYSPPYGSAKDPVNIAGSVAANYMRGQYHFIQPSDLVANLSEYNVIDVRTEREFQHGHIAGASNWPVDDLRDRMTDLVAVKDERPVVLCCRVGFRSYLAYRTLVQSGFDKVFNLDGGMTSWLSHEFPVER